MNIKLSFQNRFMVPKRKHTYFRMTWEVMIKAQHVQQMVTTLAKGCAVGCV